MADVTADINQTRAVRIAQRRIEGFAQQFGEAHCNLARHAAFPLVLTPDLLYQIWANFVPEAPWTAVAHVLLSRLCRQVGYEMYEMDISDRNLLLRELKEQFEQKRFDDLGEFLLDYVAQRLTDDDTDTRDLREAQEWTALVYTKPIEAARELAQRLSERMQQEDTYEVLRVASLVESYTEPLLKSGFEPLLIYTNGIKNYVNQHYEVATEKLNNLFVDIEYIEIAGINLTPPPELTLSRQQKFTIDKKQGNHLEVEELAALRKIQDEHSTIGEVINIDWQTVSHEILSGQQRLTTNPLTSGEGITYRTEQVYVPLGLVERKKQPRISQDVSLEQSSELYREIEITQRFEHQQFLEQILRDRQSPKSQGKRIAIIGEPGSGKTTFLQQIAQWVSQEIEQSIVIWVSLADLRSRDLKSYLLEVWLQAAARRCGQAQASTQIKDDFVAQFNQGLVWLFLDGVDEMQGIVSNPLGEIERKFRTETLLQQSRIVLSCRLNLWDSSSNSLDSFDNYRIVEFSYPQQVEQFINNWFSPLASVKTQTGQKLCAALRESGNERIRDLVKNPLRLRLLCSNWYLSEGDLPKTKAGLYEQFVADFYEWKKDVFATTAEQRRQLNAALVELAQDAFEQEVTKFRLSQQFVCKYLGEPDNPDSLFELALRLGLLNKVGVDGENYRQGVYEFFHPAFQEYFASLA
ncbi:NACHT domain-containing protein [Nostoc sp.]|uniref:NACHT domain-containing protein n=1 Tax=Nostoc sp. TaxID=1180 RepID=UPI002FFB0D25